MEVEIERFVPSSRGLVGRSPRERTALARAFVAKAVLGLTQTSDLVERLNADALLRRLCGFDLRRRAPLNESLFSRAFAEFTAQELPARVHAALIQNQLGDALIGHLSRDATAIEARERPVKVQPAPATVPHKRGRPRKDEVRPPQGPDPHRTSGGRHESAGDAGRPAHGLRRGHQAQQPGLQDHLDRLQAALGRGRRHGPDLGGADFGQCARLAGRHPAGSHERAARDESLRPDGRGLLQPDPARAQPESGACAVIAARSPI